MVKTEVKKKDGTHIMIEGSEEEVKRLLSLIQSDKTEKSRKPKEEKSTKTAKMSIGDMLLELKEEGFFDKPRSLVEIKNALAEKGGIYEITTLSTQVIRQVRKRILGRIKKEKKWMYVTR
jgi:hypothetical protein